MTDAVPHGDHEHGPSHDHDRRHAFTESHINDYKQLALSRLGWSLGITVATMVVELVGGWVSGSIALISDAGHMATHAFAILLSMLGIYLARQPACHHRTFGLLRAEVLAAFTNGLALVLVSAWIVVESVRRFANPTSILAVHMLAVAVLGLLVNIASVALLEGSRHDDLNVSSVFMHMIGDAASSVAVIGAAILIRYTGWIWVDPLVSIGIAVWIAVWALSLLRESARVLLEMAPRGTDVHAVSDTLRRNRPEIQRVYREHLWSITQERVCFSAHVELDPAIVDPLALTAWLQDAGERLRSEHGLAEVTLQVHWTGPDTL